MKSKLLSQAVLDALDLHAVEACPDLSALPREGRALVVASGNALSTGRILFEDSPAVFASESVFRRDLARESEVAFAVVISASGGKHAPMVISSLKEYGLDTYLITCRAESPGAALVSPRRLIVSPALEEPITYNTSSYLGMILAKTKEDPHEIKRHILDLVAPRVPAVIDNRAFYLLVPSLFDAQRDMLLVKFDELFGGHVNARCYTPEQTLHAKTLVPRDDELFLSFGYENALFGKERLNLPLPPGAQHGAMLAIAYYVIGRIQETLPPWFFNHCEEYEEDLKDLFARFQELPDDWV